MNNPFEVTEKNETILTKIDNFEDKINLLNQLTKDYDNLKKEIKEEMLKIGKENNLTQMKWETPKGIKITLSIGQKPEFEEVEELQFNLETLIKDYPEIYEKCCVTKKVNKIIKNGSNDRMVITLPKKGE